MFGKSGFCSFGPAPKKKEESIQGLFRRPEECMPIEELGFQIVTGTCPGCARYPYVKECAA